MASIEKSALRVDNSGRQCLAGAACEGLDFISVAVRRMSRSPPQVRVLPTCRARHTIVCPKHALLGLGLRCGQASLRSACPRSRLLRGLLSTGSVHTDPVADGYRSRRSTKSKIWTVPSALNLCSAQISFDYFTNWSRNGCRGLGSWSLELAMDCSDVAPSGLPSLLLPCPHCGHRMVITAVGPALFANGATANDLQDVTHSCEQCGTKLSRTIRPLASAA
jgi:hypothetical protein